MAATPEKHAQILGVCLAAGLLYFSTLGEPHPGPEPPVPDGTADLRSAFAGSNRTRPQQREDAQALADQCAAVAEFVEFDGRSEQPRLKTGNQVHDLRITTRHLVEHGGSYGAAYPVLGERLAAFLAERVGNDDEPLSGASRKQWHDAFADLSAALQRAARGL